ncbi:MAG: glycosyltransferase family 2 protein [Candidatus Paceibacteria bacterium]
MKISIIIATYNRAQLLPKAIASVLAQTYQNWELVVVDDGSTDTTDEVMRGYTHDLRIIFHRLSQNQGATAARNYGLSKATGDVLMVWDSDDILFPEALERVTTLFAEQPEASIISAHCRQIKQGAVIPYTPLATGYKSVEAIVARILPANTKIRAVKKSVFTDVRYEARNIDFTVNCYLAERGQWYHSNEELGELYLESDTVSLTTSRYTFKPGRSIERVEPLKRFLTHFKTILIKHAPQRLGALSYGASIGLLLMKEKRQAIQYAWQAVRYDWSLKHALWFLFVLLPGSGVLLRFYTGAT